MLKCKCAYDHTSTHTHRQRVCGEGVACVCADMTQRDSDTEITQSRIGTRARPHLVTTSHKCFCSTVGSQVTGLYIARRQKTPPHPLVQPGKDKDKMLCSKMRDVRFGLTLRATDAQKLEDTEIWMVKQMSFFCFLLTIAKNVE